MYIIKELDSGVVSTAKIAHSLNVSIRTAQRYMNAIEIIFPLSFLGQGKYRFMEGFSLKTGRTTQEEASMLVLLSEVAKSLGKNFGNSFENIKQKVLCPPSESPFYIKMPKTLGYNKTEVTDCIEGAVERHKVITISYAKTENEIRKYIVQPYKIVNFEGFWYLYAIKGGEKRTFKLEKITACMETGKTFGPKKYILKRLDESTNIWFGLNKKIKATLSVDKAVVKLFKTKEYFPLQRIIKTKKNGDIIIKTSVGDYAEILHTVFYWIPFVKIISPKELKDMAYERAKVFLK